MDYDEQKEIDLIHGIVESPQFTEKYEKYLHLWAKRHDIPAPKLKVIRTTPLLSQGYYTEGQIFIYYSENQDEEDLLATLAHEYGHHYFYLKKIQYNLKQEEIQADLLAAALIGKTLVINNLKKRRIYHENGIHPSIKLRIESIQNK